MNFIIVGVGGTGSAVATMLSRMYDNSQFLLVDADKVEESNIKRQAYQQHDVGEYKAEALAIKLNSAGNQTNKHYAHNKYLLDPEDLTTISNKYFQTHYCETITLIGCVDNHPARMIMENWVKRINSKICYIDSANEEWNGEVVKIVNKLSGYSKFDLVGKFRSDRFKAVKRAKKGNRANISCGEAIDSGGIQQYSTNSMAANIIMQMVNGKDTGICYFDTRKLVMHYEKDKVE